MSDGSSSPDSRVLSGLSRRRLLALAGVGVASLAGCAGDGDDGGETGTPTSTPTATATDAPTAADTPTATPTATVTATESPTATRSVQEQLDHYGCPNLEKDGDYDMVVAQDGSGDHETVQGAIDALAPRTFEEQRVFIKNGRYKEKLEISSNLTDVTFIGEDPEETVLTYDAHAGEPGEGGEIVHPTATWSVSIGAMDFAARDVTFENAADSSAQAIATRVVGDRAVFENCRFLGNQDTLSTHGQASRQYYRNCYVEGDVDFVFGASTAYFDNCKIFCKDQGYISAASTPEGSEYGHVFVDCRVHGDAGENAMYLGRPWKPYGQTVYLNCELGDVIRPAGWDPWHEAKRPDKTETAFLAEYDNSGPGYTPEERVEWSHQLSEDEAQPYMDPETVLGGWDPTTCL